MEPIYVVPIFIAFVVLALFLRLAAGSLDNGRVERYVRRQGGRVLEQRWTPFGRGWFGEKDSRIYEVVYEDAEENVHRATCKTGWLSGVYFTEDQIIEGEDTTGPLASGQGALEEENRRLREELRRLRAERQGEHV